MKHMLAWMDPSALAGLAVTFFLFLCAALLYMMRDPIPYPRRVARRVRCPHEDHKYTIEFTPSQEDAVLYCSAFPYGQMRCDQACLAAHGASRKA